MIKVDTMDRPAGVTMTLTPPVTPLDVRIAGQRLLTFPRWVWRRLLLEVISLEDLEPATLWEDLSLAPYVPYLHAVAIVTDAPAYARLTTLKGALHPGLTVRHFEPPDRDAALSWLRTIQG